MAPIPKIKATDRNRTYDTSFGGSERISEMRELVDRLSPDILRDYVRRSALPQELLDGIRGPTARRIDLSASALNMPSLEFLKFPVSRLAAEHAVRAVVSFMESAPATGKKGGDTRILVTIDPTTGSVDHLQFADATDKPAQIPTDGNRSLTLGVRFDKKNNVTRVIVDPATKTALHKLGEKGVSPELRQALGALHGRVIKITGKAPAESKPPSLPSSALSLGGLSGGDRPGVKKAVRLRQRLRKIHATRRDPKELRLFSQGGRGS